MSKRPTSIQTLVDSVNAILSLPEITILKNEKLETVTSDSSDGQVFKDGLCECLHIALHASKSYKGYTYLELDDNNNPVDKFKRKYY
jgi:hypothetical protein